MHSVMDRWRELLANSQGLLKEPDVEVLRHVDKEMHRLAAANKRLQAQIENLGHDAQWDHDVVIPDLAARVEEAEEKADRLQKHFDGAMAVLQREQELRRATAVNKRHHLLENLRPMEDVLGEGIDEITLLRDEVQRITYERDAYKRDFDAELAGSASLRSKHGARDDETMFTFLERLDKERNDAVMQAGAVSTDSISLKGEIASLRHRNDKLEAMLKESVKLCNDIAIALDCPTGWHNALEKARELKATIKVLGGDDHVDVGDIITAYIKAHGYDGLYHEDGECACELSDLFPCGEVGLSCSPGMKCDDKSGEYDFLIVDRRSHAERVRDEEDNE